MRFSGIVAKGKGFGATIGFPTANIPLPDKDISGIYAATVILGGTAYPAAAYADQKRGLLEAHLLDFSSDIYEKEITIELGGKVREDRAFADVEALKAQIAADVGVIRTLGAAKERTI